MIWLVKLIRWFKCCDDRRRLAHINKHMVWLNRYMQGVNRDVRKRIKKDVFDQGMSNFWLEGK